MKRRFELRIAVAVLLTALAAPIATATAPVWAQMPTPVLENGAAGDGAGAAPLPGISLPILATLLFVGIGIGLCAVTIIRRWERQNDPDVRARQHRAREAQDPPLRR